ncbi:monocarboxylate transporter 9-like [Watersipora subatra]|uniref:monocarboxylate transporter 9-like n=1 Tax=Watersipora subatra TaxID=2589382 RepID=UPI00355BF791
MAVPIWYKWVILAATSISTFASYGYITGSSSIGTVYYIQIYSERIISGIVGPIQMSMHKIACLPAFYMNKKLGNRWLQVIGGVLLSGGIALTAVTSFSWQALLLSGIVSGSGSGMLHVATTNIIKEYFPGKQIGPFGAACLSLNLATVVVPQLWRYLMTALSWQLALITIGAILSINIVCGLTFLKSDHLSMGVTSKPRQKLNLFLKRKSSGIYTAADRSEWDQDLNKTNLDILLSQSEDAEFEKLSEEAEKRSGNGLPTSNKEEGSDDGMLQTLKMPEV